MAAAFSDNIIRATGAHANALNEGCFVPTKRGLKEKPANCDTNADVAFRDQSQPRHRPPHPDDRCRRGVPGVSG